VPLTRRILHLSDPHVTAQGADQDGVDSLRALEGLLDDCRNVAGIDAVIVTGDIADDGSAEACDLVRDRVGKFASARGIPHIYTTGNHDRRVPFTAALGSGHISAAGVETGTMLDGLDDERAAVSMVGGLRIVTLDSLVTGAVHGLISSAQLGALRRVLARPAPEGTVLALHHPPIHSPTAPWTQDAGLRNRKEFAAAIADSDVLAVLCGHFHLQMTGRMGAATVWATPGVVTRIDLTAPSHVVRAVHGASASVVELGGPFSPSFHVLHSRDPQMGQEVYVADPTTWQVIREEV
jgi:3',5'-cyclic-AMP phosphodiesterase